MWLFWSVFFSTFVLEDAALISALSLSSVGMMSVQRAFLACFLGIAIGDLLVYALGAFFRRLTPSIKPTSRTGRLIKWFSEFKYSQTLTYMIVASRAIPGTRLPTYLLAGYTSYSLLKFSLLTAVSVFVWVLFAFTLGRSVQALISGHWFYSALVLLLLFILVRKLLPILADRWRRRHLLYAWLKWTSFEFWPPWLFYLPIVPRYIFLSLKHRSFFMPFYANPGIRHAGLIGESKWDFYQYLGGSEFALKTRLLQTDEALEQIKKLIESGEFQFPFILKPDVGQRGFAVRIIHDEAELHDYLKEAKFDLLIQELSCYSGEAGVFYCRQPDNTKGFIFSVTDKRFPFVVGDGASPLGKLILKDRRARIIAPTYFSRFEGELDHIPQKGEKVLLSTCGNHCQGAIFLNGQWLRTEELLAAIERTAQLIPDFYFGRFDLRYSTVDDLRLGKSIQIVEVNGAGSEATHIWDSQTSLKEAYSVLFEQWGLLFSIGAQVRKNKILKYPFNLRLFLYDLFSLSRQNKKLSTSS